MFPRRFHGRHPHGPSPLSALVAAVGVVLPGVAAMTAARAATDVSVQGNIPVTCFVSVSGSDDIIDLNQAGDGVVLGAMGQGCNDAVGYMVTLSSTNGGALVDGNGDKLPYTISYDALSSSLAQPQTINHLDPLLTPKVAPIKLRVPSGAGGRHGLYSDTLVITVSAR